MSVFLRIGFIAAWVGAAACAGEIENRDEIVALLSTVDGGINGGNGQAPSTVACASLGVTDAYQELVLPSCGTVGCHGEGSAQAGLSLEGDLSELIDEPANATGCTQLLVDSATVSQSLMLILLEDSPPCSSQMPFLPPPLTADEKTCMRAWVESLVQVQ